MGQQLDDPKFDRHLASLIPHQRRRGRISDGDIARTMIGLICGGQAPLRCGRGVRWRPLLSESLGSGKNCPPAEILRQRIQGMPEEAGDAFRDLATRLLAGQGELLVSFHHGRQYLPINIDVTPMDNSGSHKEGVSCTYKKFDGYAPIVAYAGPHGFILNNELREGSAHCNCEGTAEWLAQTLKRAKAVAPKIRPGWWSPTPATMRPRTCCCSLKTSDTDFLVKGNLRRQDPAAVGWPKPAGKPRCRTSWIAGPAPGMAETTERSGRDRFRRGPRILRAGGLAGHQAFCRLRWPAVDGTRD
ncbi:MAG: hypothetical protein U5K69_22580 [Balneolaceae bacterium]|nr:hypothetical protein [Balneolaceae bacterium]